MENKILLKIKNYVCVFELLLLVASLIIIIILIINDFSKSKIDIENKVFNNFCNYALNNNLIDKDKYILENIYSNNEDLEMQIDNDYTVKDVCIDIYVKYILELDK